MRLLDFLHIGLNTPPRDTLRWLNRQIKSKRADRQLPGWERWLGGRTLAGSLAQRDVAAALKLLEASNPFPGLRDHVKVRAAVSDDVRKEIKARAHKAMHLEIDLLGSGPVQLTRPIDWATDFKSGTRWPMSASRALPVNDLGRPSDIKVPWDLSRLQWLLPAGQAFVLENDQAAATFAHEIIEDWITANPICRGPNWICAMDVALRAVSMLWLFYACKDAHAWKNTAFREKLLKSLVLHGQFIDTHLEFADVNGNHLTADLCGLTLLGIALGGQGIAKKWINKSWRLLCEQLPEQVPEDGVCREASLPYHRLVAELFALPSLARLTTGRDVPQAYLQRLRDMAAFTEAATRPDGEVPVWGDADDGRALPLGTQAMNDHRYLVDLLMGIGRPSRDTVHDETLWWLGTGTAIADKPDVRKAFETAGVYILGNGDDHIFIDAGPVGMNGRGGHGHNDCLSFEASLLGQRLVIDPGSYVYTADMESRNRYRATSAHNTPKIDGEEINRFVSPRSLWRLRNDAVPEVRLARQGGEIEILTASHAGYRRLPSPVTPVRSFIYEKSSHNLIVCDRFEGDGPHSVETCLTMAPDVEVERQKAGIWRLQGTLETFLLVADLRGWDAELMQRDVSASYGLRSKTRALMFSRQGELTPLTFALIPEKTASPDPIRWLSGVVRDHFDN